jgi:hypothetical protein
LILISTLVEQGKLRQSSRVPTQGIGKYGDEERKMEVQRREKEEG